MTIEFRVKPGPVLPATTGDAGLRKNAQNSQDTAKARAGALDTLTVTEPAARLQHSAGALAEQPLVDVSRVESIRRELARGHYEPDMARVAEKLFSFERALRI